MQFRPANYIDEFGKDSVVFLAAESPNVLSGAYVPSIHRLLTVFCQILVLDSSESILETVSENLDKFNSRAFWPGWDLSVL